MITLNNKEADIYIPEEQSLLEALKSTTHLCIAALQDDVEILAYHGIAKCFGQKNLRFGSIVMTDGAGSPRAGIYKNYSDEEMKTIRKKEQRKAALIGNYSFQIQLAYPSSKVKAKDQAIEQDLLQILSHIKSKIIYVHNPADKHDTHIATCVQSVKAIKKLAKENQPEQLLGCEVWRDLDWLCDENKVALAVDSYPNLSASILGVFDSQISGGKRYDLAAIGRRTANATFFASHSVDSCSALTFAMDLTPVLTSDITIRDIVEKNIDKFKNEVMSKF